MIRLSRIESDYQIVTVLPHAGGRAIAPAELAELQLPPDVDLSQPVILFGAVPIWVYGRLVSLCREAPWIGCFSAPEAQAVVVHSRKAGVAVGDVVAVPLLRDRLAPAILVVGPPDSGKSVLSNTLRVNLTAQYPDCSFFLHRANWDGEGNWSHEGDRTLIQRLVRDHERRIHERPSAQELMAAFFAYHEAAVMNLRQVVDLVIVDVGGKAQPEKMGVRDRCTNGIIISRAPDLVQEWREFCEPTVDMVAIIHSVLEERCEVVSESPLLEIVAGAWLRGQTHRVPEAVLQAVGRLMDAPIRGLSSH